MNRFEIYNRKILFLLTIFVFTCCEQVYSQNEFQIKSCDCDIELIEDDQKSNDGKESVTIKKISKKECKPRMPVSAGSRVRCSDNGKLKMIIDKETGIEVLIENLWVTITNEDNFFTGALSDLYRTAGRARTAGIVWPANKSKEYAVNPISLSIIIYPTLKDRPDDIHLIVGVENSADKYSVSVQDNTWKIDDNNLRQYLISMMDESTDRDAWLKLQNNKGETVFSQINFKIMSKNKQKILTDTLAKYDSSGTGLQEIIRAHIFLQNDLIYDAIEEYNLYIKNFPDNEMVLKKLNNLYESIGISNKEIQK